MQSISEVLSAMNICPIQNLETCNFIKMKNLSFFDRSIAFSKMLSFKKVNLMR